MSTIHEGDTVAVKFTGKVVTANRGYVRVETDGLRSTVLPAHVTVIGSRYIPGAMYVDVNGVYYLRTYSDSWIFAAGGNTVEDDIPVRPLRRLIPEGE